MWDILFLFTSRYTPAYSDTMNNNSFGAHKVKLYLCADATTNELVNEAKCISGGEGVKYIRNEKNGTLWMVFVCICTVYAYHFDRQYLLWTEFHRFFFHCSPQSMFTLTFNMHQQSSRAVCCICVRFSTFVCIPTQKWNLQTFFLLHILLLKNLHIVQQQQNPSLLYMWCATQFLFSHLFVSTFDISLSLVFIQLRTFLWSMYLLVHKLSKSEWYAMHKSFNWNNSLIKNCKYTINVYRLNSKTSEVWTLRRFYESIHLNSETTLFQCSTNSTHNTTCTKKIRTRRRTKTAAMTLNHSFWKILFSIILFHLSSPSEISLSTKEFSFRITRIFLTTCQMKKVIKLYETML